MHSASIHGQNPTESRVNSILLGQFSLALEKTACEYMFESMLF